MKTIALTRNQVALVSDEDFEYLSGFNWSVQVSPYVRTLYAKRNQLLYECASKSKRTVIKMHRAIAELMGLDLTNHIDHIDGNGLNNQRENLRSATHQQNMRNQTCKKKGFSSKYKGVSWYKPNKKWRARIRINSVLIHLGYFVNEIDAAMTYNEAATKHFGEFAALNKIEYLEIECSNFTPLTINQKMLSIQRRKRKGCGSSEYVGVSWYKPNKKWQASITINSVQVYLGRFVKEHEAATAYNEAATKHYGEFAALNIILEQQIN